MDNELVSLFQQEAPKTTMTTKEIAEAFGVDERTIQRTAKKLFDSTAEKPKTESRGGRPTMVFTSEQATLLKEEISRHHNLKTREIDDVETQESIAKDIKRGMDALAKWNAILMKRRDELEKEVADLKPKAELADSYLDRSTFYCFTDAAHVLGVGRKELMTLLKSKYIYEVPNCKYAYRPYAEYKKYFQRRPFELPGGKSGFQLMLNLRGIEFFGKILKAREEKEIEGGRGDGK